MDVQIWFWTDGHFTSEHLWALNAFAGLVALTIDSNMVCKSKKSNINHQTDGKGLVCRYPRLTESSRSRLDSRPSHGKERKQPQLHSLRLHLKGQGVWWCDRPWQALLSTCDVTLHLLLFYRPSTRCTRDVLWKTDFSCPLVCEDSVNFINHYFLSESLLLVMKSSLTLNPILLLSVFPVFYSCCTLHFSDYINPKCLILKGKKRKYLML